MMNPLMLVKRFFLYLMILLHPYPNHLFPWEEHMLSSCSDSSFNPDQEPGKTFSRNLGHFLLSAQIASSTAYFKNLTSGEGDGKVYGMFWCRGDISSDVCNHCISTASNQLQFKCYNQMSAHTLYKNCFLLYSKIPFSGVVDTSYEMMAWSPDGLAQFNRLVEKTMDKTALRAAYNSSNGKLFGVGKAISMFTPPDDKLYTFAECTTPDISRVDCYACLTTAISHLPDCCDNKKGGRVAYTSCNIRYELYKFYNATPPDDDNETTKTTIIITVVFVSIISLTVVSRIMKKRELEYKDETTDEDEDEIDFPTETDPLRYSSSEVTKNFYVKNFIGQGGSGSVYKATLPDRQIVAAKRLFRSSVQDDEDFLNRIAILTKLQHENLVRLLGYCLKRKEKILIYEFVLSKRLDYFLFDPVKQPLLEWLTRYKIIEGIARGLFYLHVSSCNKIIHGDLKAGNVLLDQNMNPKITDFGMSRFFQIDQSEENTSRIADPSGYIVPEYALHDMLSMESDVFNFGVLVLEIISGKKSNMRLQEFDCDDLISYARRKWRNRTPLEVMDSSMKNSDDQNEEVIRCIYIALLCVEEDMEQRPTIALVSWMLDDFSLTPSTPMNWPKESHALNKSGRKDRRVGLFEALLR